MTEDPKGLVPRFFAETAGSYDRVVSWCTFGKDRRWKRAINNLIPESQDILELASGTGILTKIIAESFPAAKIVGVDITTGYIKEAEKRLAANENVTFFLEDAERLRLDMRFDCIVSSYIPKYCSAEALITMCVRHLKPGGRIILHDFTYPASKAVRFLWNCYFGILRTIGCFVPSWRAAFADLPGLIRSSRWQAEYQSTMRSQGLKVSIIHLTWHSSSIIVGDYARET